MSFVDLEVTPDPEDPEGCDIDLWARLGRHPIRFRLDTGASTCVVPVGPATRHLPAVGTDSGAGASGVALHEDEIVIPEITIAGHMVDNVDASRFEPAPRRKPLLGMNVLGRFCCEFDFAAPRLGLHPTSSGPTDGWIPLDVGDRGHPMVPLEFDDVTVAACWDTGAGLTVLDVGFLASHPGLYRPLRSAVGFDAGGVEVGGEVGVLASCMIGNVSFGETACLAFDFGPINAHLPEPLIAVIGTPIITAAHWWFDFPARRWQVSSVSNTTGR